MIAKTITVGAGATINGRALAIETAVTLDSDSIIYPAAGAYFAKMTADQSVPPTLSCGHGTLNLVAIDQKDGGYLVGVTGVLTGFGADVGTSATIRNKHAGLNGGILEGNLYSVANSAGAGAVTVSGSQNFSWAAMQEMVEGRAYLNLPTTMLGAGAIRGQILRPGQLLRSAQLSGANQVPANSTGQVGGAGFIVSSEGSVSYEGSWAVNVVATGAQTQSGDAGVNGPIVAPLMLVGTTGFKGVLSIGQAGAGEQYVTVDTADAGGGLIRGQIVKH